MTQYCLREQVDPALNEWLSGFFPSLWEGLREGAKLDAHKPSPQPSPKRRGGKTSKSFHNEVD